MIHLSQEVTHLEWIQVAIPGAKKPWEVLLLRLDNVPSTPYDSPLIGGYTPESDEGMMKLDELITLCRKRSKQVLDLDRRKYKQVKTSSDDGLDEEDASKQERISHKIRPMFTDKDFKELDDHMENVEEETVDAATTEISTAATLIKMKEQKAKEKGVAITDVEDSSRTVRPVRSITTLQLLPTIDPKDKGKVVLVEEPVKIKKKDQGDLQIQADAELAQRLHEEELAEFERR
ncbi:hypothetical protein Tco_1325776 [Tanacetum coccineum]